MRFDWLKLSMPRSLYGRAALILLLPVVTLQLGISISFFQRHFAEVTQQMTRNVARELRLVLAQMPASDAQLPQVMADADALEIDVSMPATALRGDLRPWYDLSGRWVISELRDSVDGVTAVDLSADRRVRVQVQGPDGVIELAFNRRRVSAANPHQLFVLMAVLGVFMTLISFIFLRNQLRPIKRLARASEAFGKGQVMAYRPSGATEVRAAGRAFLDMRARIERQIEHRTQMLSGVSHDLRTPLTRLKLGLSMLDGEDVEDLNRDVQDMEHLVNSFLAFAKEDAEEDACITDPFALIDTVVGDFQRMGEDVTLGERVGAGQMSLRPVALRRALDNLIGNAVRYGSRARLSIRLTDRWLTIVIEDDGPGIAAEDREASMSPFTRLEPARNQNKGSGVGLGMAIARDATRAHGGRLQLGQSEDLGGLSAQLILPR